MFNNFLSYFRSDVTQPETHTHKREALGAVTDEYVLDLSSHKRQELVTMSDFMHNTIPDASAIVSRMTRYSIGDGLRPSMHTADVNFNEKINTLLDLYTNDKNRTDVQRKLDFYDFQKKVARALLTPGECFILMVKDNNPKTPLRRGFQLIDVNRVYGDYSNVKFKRKDVNVIDGVVRDLLGVHLGYIVWPSVLDNKEKDVAYDNWQSYFVSSRDIMHCVDYTARPDVIRGLPKAVSGLTMGKDSNELRESITKKLKTIHEYALAFKKSTDVDPFNVSEASADGKLSNKAKEASKNDNVASGLKRAFKGAAQILSIAKEDEIDIIESSLPSSDVRAYMADLMDGIAKAYSVHPTALLNPNELKGTAIRFVISDTEKAITELQNLVIKSFSLRAITWYLCGEIADGRIKDAPLGWWTSLRFSKPTRLTVDYGRDSKTDMDLIGQGLLTQQDYHNARDRDWKQVIVQQAEEAKFKKETAKKAGIDISDITKERPGSTNVKKV